MSSQIRIVKEKLNLAITQLCETSWMFVKNPNRDFTRERKLPLREVISILLCMEGGSLTGELLRYFRCSRYSPSSSAFIQQRQKINEFAFPSLFSLFVKHTDKDRLYKGYRLLAADGSDIQIPTDSKHTASYFHGTNGQTPYNLLHLDAVYDLCQHTYLDAQVCGRRNSDERGTLCEMVDRSDITNALIIADWYVDIMAANLVDPATRSRFQVFLLPNLYGDILTDEAAQLQGDVGTAGSANIGTRYAMFDAIHGTAPRLIAEGKGDYANPTSILRAAAMLLRHIGRQAEASRLDRALDDTHVTQEMTCAQIGASVEAKL